LDRLAAAGERLPLPNAYGIALAVSRCVWHAHRRGVLHRDIKPANVLLPTSGAPAAKVSDSGISWLADVAGATPPGTITGTPRFASPEALAGQAVGPPHDVYGLAATLYTLFAGGSPPHQIPPSASIATLRRILGDERPEALRIRTPDVDPDVERALMQALTFKAMDRPTAGQLVLTLERAHPPR
jgi:serine/threonine protein kinase